MKRVYIITGAAGHLAGTIIQYLRKTECEIRGLILPSENGESDSQITYYKGDITETARLTERRIVAADDVLSENDSALNDLRQRISQHPVVTVSLFVPDEHKDGGSTVTETGSLKSIDEQTGSLVFENGLRISARDIVSLKEENQGNYAGNCP